MPGPIVRTDIVEVYVFRRSPPGHTRSLQVLQLRRATGPLADTWQPVMGHIRQAESAAHAAWRELAEETALAHSNAILGMWQLEEPSQYFLYHDDAIMLSPGFAIEIKPDIDPVLNHEHHAHRWVGRAQADRAFLWPGQRHAVRQIVRDILEPASPVAHILRIDLKDLPCS